MARCSPFLTFSLPRDPFPEVLDRPIDEDQDPHQRDPARDRVNHFHQVARFLLTPSRRGAPAGCRPNTTTRPDRRRPVGAAASSCPLDTSTEASPLPERGGRAATGSRTARERAPPSERQSCSDSRPFLHTIIPKTGSALGARPSFPPRPPSFPRPTPNADRRRTNLQAPHPQKTPIQGLPPCGRRRRRHTGCYGALHRLRRTGDQQIELSKRKKVRARAPSTSVPRVPSHLIYLLRSFWVRLRSQPAPERHPCPKDEGRRQVNGGGHLLSTPPPESVICRTK